MPCIKCSNGKWKFGLRGTCQFDSLAACKKGAAAIKAQRGSEVVMPERTMLSVQATPDVAGIRTAEFRGQEHTVIPVIALVEGVLWPANAPSPELALAEEFGRFPEGWDGSPVVFDHPRDSEGAPIAANSPDVLEENSFGQIFNTTLDGTKLKSEIWVNNDLVQNLTEEAQATVAKLISGDTVVEVSTGLFMLAEPATGEFNGERFDAIWRNIVPDHLAILPEGVAGACSVEDGCGAPRSNQGNVLTFTNGNSAKPFEPVMRAARMHEACGANGDSIITNDDGPEDVKAQKTFLKRLMQRASAIFAPRDNSEGISDRDLRTALDIAVTDDEKDFIFITAVFQSDDNSGTVVYEKGFEPLFFERSFTMNDDGSIDLGEEKTAVRPETKFVPIELSGTESDGTIQENAMNPKEELVNELIANEAVQFTEEDRVWLTSLEEAQLTKLSPVDNSDGDANSGGGSDTDTIDLHAVSDVDAAAAEAEAAAAAAGGEVTPVSTEDYIADAPVEVQAVLNQGLSMHRARKDALVGALTANSRCRFTKEQLEGKEISELESLAALAVDISYEGAAPVLTIAADADAVPEPPQLFDLNNAGAA